MAWRVRLLPILLIGPVLAVVALLVVWMLFRTYGGILAIEQVVLARWLRPAYLGDGRPASELLLCYPMGLAINRVGELLISDRGRERRGRVVWRIDSKGIAHIVAGTGRRGEATEPWALELNLKMPEGLAVAADGSVFLSDGWNHSVYRIDPEGRVERIAGTGSPGFSGDGGIASQAMLFRPADIRIDRAGNLFIADVAIIVFVRSIPLVGSRRWRAPASRASAPTGLLRHGPSSTRPGAWGWTFRTDCCSQMVQTIAYVASRTTDGW
jgi:hypothetical protein